MDVYTTYRSPIGLASAVLTKTHVHTHILKPMDVQRVTGNLEPKLMDHHKKSPKQEPKRLYAHGSWALDYTVSVRHDSKTIHVHTSVHFILRKFYLCTGHIDL